MKIKTSSSKVGSFGRRSKEVFLYLETSGMAANHWNGTAGVRFTLGDRECQMYLTEEQVSELVNYFKRLEVFMKESLK